MLISLITIELGITSIPSLNWIQSQYLHERKRNALSYLLHAQQGVNDFANSKCNGMQCYADGISLALHCIVKVNGNPRVESYKL